MKKGKTIVLFLLSFLLCLIVPSIGVKASEDTSIGCYVDYKDENIIISKGSNKNFYFTDEAGYKKDSWETMGIGSDKTMVFDISWTNPAKETILYMKGDIDKRVVKIVLPKQEPKVKVVLKPKEVSIDQMIHFTANERKIPLSQLEWRKGISTNWQSGEKLTKQILEGMQMKGAQIYFRVAPVNSSFVSNNNSIQDGVRSGKIVKLSIPKMVNAPVISVDPVSLTINVKDTMEYSLSGAEGSYIKFPSGTKSADLAKLLSQGGVIEETTLYIRLAATETKAASKVKAVEIPEQQEAPDDDFLIAYSETGITLKNTADVTIQYVIVSSRADITTKTSWKSLKKGATAAIKKSSAPEGKLICYRTAAVKASPNVSLALVSKIGFQTLNYKGENTGSSEELELKPVTLQLFSAASGPGATDQQKRYGGLYFKITDPNDIAAWKKEVVYYNYYVRVYDEEENYICLIRSDRPEGTISIGKQSQDEESVIEINKKYRAEAFITVDYSGNGWVMEESDVSPMTKLVETSYTEGYYYIPAPESLTMKLNSEDGFEYKAILPKDTNRAYYYSFTFYEEDKEGTISMTEGPVIPVGSFKQENILEGQTDMRSVYSDIWYPDTGIQEGWKYYIRVNGIIEEDEMEYYAHSLERCFKNSEIFIK